MFGVASGAFGYRVYEARNVAHAIDSPAQGSPFNVERLQKELDLTDDQVERVRKILDETIMDEADLMTQIRDRRDRARELIMAMLNADQRVKFESMRKHQAAAY